jgi:hypothetical protein
MCARAIFAGDVMSPLKPEIRQNADWLSRVQHELLRPRAFCMNSSISHSPSALAQKTMVLISFIPCQCY